MLRGGASTTETNEARERGEPDRYQAASDLERDTDAYWTALRRGYWTVPGNPYLRVELSPYDRPPEHPDAQPRPEDYGPGVAGSAAYQRALHDRETAYQRVNCGRCGRGGWTYLAAGQHPPDTIRCDRCTDNQRSGHGEPSR